MKSVSSTIMAGQAPRPLGGLISDALLLLRGALPLFVSLALPVAVVEFAALELLRASGTALLGAAGMVERDPAAAWASFLVTGVPALSVGMMLLAATHMAGVLFVRACHALSGAMAPSPRAVLAAAGQQVLGVLVTWLCWMAGLLLVVLCPPALLGIALLWWLPGPQVLVVALVLAGAWVVVTAIGSLLRWSLWMQVVVVEGGSGLRALKRSRHLMSPPTAALRHSPKVHLSVLLLVYFALSSSLQSTFTLPVALYALLQNQPLETASLWQLPWPAAFALALLQVAAQSLLLPLGSVLTTLFFYDVRLRFEGVGRAGPGAAPGAFPAGARP